MASVTFLVVLWREVNAENQPPWWAEAGTVFGGEGGRAGLTPLLHRCVKTLDRCHTPPLAQVQMLQYKQALL